MEIACSLAILLILAALTWAAMLLKKYGLAECLYIASAHLQAAGDAVAIAQEQHRRSLAVYQAEARLATRAIQEAL